MIDEKSIEQLKEITDIVDVISHYVEVKKMGANYKCVCPFHDDKNPSMSINPSKQFYHCFACKAGGDAIKFVKDIEKISYPEAVEKVAQLSNFTLTYTKDAPKHRENKQILENINALYRADLAHASAAQEYLRSRFITPELANKFELGWADESARTIRALENSGVSVQEALEIGIVKQSERGIYASFSQRITFPIYSHTSRLVGFGGRTISDHPAKYVNSPQSEIFDKSRLLYGYHLARQSIAKKRQIIITEGYLDVIMLHSVGFDNAVAVLGTALTHKHLPLLKRDEIHVILCFDGDSAGVNAAVKSALLLSQNDVDGSVVIIDGGADPADMVVAGKIDYLHKIFSSGTELGEFYIRHIASQHDLSRPVLRQKCLEEIVAYTRTLKFLQAQSYTSLVAQLLGIDVHLINLTPNSNQQSFIQSPKNPPRELITEQKKDILELSLIKSMLKFEKFLQIAEDENLSSAHFMCHQDLYAAVIAPPCEERDRRIREIELDESSKPIEDDANFLKAIARLRLRYLEMSREQIRAGKDDDRLSKLVEIGKCINELQRKI